MMLLNNLIQAMKICQVRNISLDGSDVPPNGLDSTIKFALTATHNIDICPFLNNQCSGHKTHPIPTPCIDCDFAFKLFHFFSSSLSSKVFFSVFESAPAATSLQS